MANIEELFGSSVFNDAVMQKRLPKDIYKALHKTITDGTPLDPQVANVVANAMKDWAVERGVTHYTHWFQPLTGITAEKHDSFAQGRRQDYPRIQRQGTRPRRAGRFLVPLRRPALHV